MQLCVHTVIKALSESSTLNTLQLLPVTFHWGQSLQRRNRLMVDEVVVLFGWIKPEGESLKTTLNTLLKQRLIKSNKAVKPHEYIKTVAQEPITHFPPITSMVNLNASCTLSGWPWLIQDKTRTVRYCPTMWAHSRTGYSDTKMIILCVYLGQLDGFT